MTFQKEVRINQALGQPGEFYDATPRRVTACKLEGIDSTKAAIGRVFTLDASGKPQLGGEGTFAGILCHPKSYARLGLDAKTAIAQGSNGELADMGRLIVLSTAVAKPGDAVQYNIATGEIAGAASGAGKAPVPGAIFALFDVEAGGLAVIQMNGAAIQAQEGENG